MARRDTIWSECFTFMADLIERIEAEIDVPSEMWIISSHADFYLCMRDSSFPEDASVYFRTSEMNFKGVEISYWMNPDIAPWRGARVIGHTDSLKTGVEMVREAIKRTAFIQASGYQWLDTGRTPHAQKLDHR